MLVQLCSYNINNRPHVKCDLTEWLHPSSASPDIYAVAVQEALPLCWSLLGLSASVVHKYSNEIKRVLDSRDAGNYSLVGNAVIGGIVLLIFSRDNTATGRIRAVSETTAGCGVFQLMGNKGAAAVKLTLAEFTEDGEQVETVYTFLSAHLAAHQNEIPARNRDWKALVRRLVFADNSQIYDSSYLFVCGDLNYRISTLAPKRLQPKVISHKIHFEHDQLLLQDQLHAEINAGNTLHGMHEGKINFHPTYKYKVGTVDTYKDFNKRIPGWCDRILYATWADHPDSEIVSTNASKKNLPIVENYDSIMSYTHSDHKPIYALIRTPELTKDNSGFSIKTPPPFDIDPQWQIKWYAGRVIDIVVGFFWTIITCLGGGNDKAGVPVLLLILAALKYMRYI